MKVAIIGGGGRVGSCAAFALQCSGIVKEIILFDANQAAAEGEALLSSVGGYHYEGRGAQLFSHVDGDAFTILGLPLLPVLAALRTQGILGT